MRPTNNAASPSRCHTPVLNGAPSKRSALPCRNPVLGTWHAECLDAGSGAWAEGRVQISCMVDSDSPTRNLGDMTHRIAKAGEMPLFLRRKVDLPASCAGINSPAPHTARRQWPRLQHLHRAVKKSEDSPIVAPHPPKPPMTAHQLPTPSNRVLVFPRFLPASKQTELTTSSSGTWTGERETTDVAQHQTIFLPVHTNTTTYSTRAVNAPPPAIPRPNSLHRCNSSSLEEPS